MTNKELIKLLLDKPLNREIMLGYPKKHIDPQYGEVAGYLFHIDDVSDFANIITIQFTDYRETENNTVIDMIHTGYSQHDCESWYKCPKCNKEYGSWGFFHKNLKGGDTFKCEKCGQTLKVPH